MFVGVIVPWDLDVHVGMPVRFFFLVLYYEQRIDTTTEPSDAMTRGAPSLFSSTSSGPRLPSWNTTKEYGRSGVLSFSNQLQHRNGELRTSQGRWLDHSVGLHVRMYALKNQYGVKALIHIHSSLPYASICILFFSTWFTNHIYAHTDYIHSLYMKIDV